MNQFELPEPQDDGLLIPDVGPWSRDKHHFLRRYLHAFTTAMRSKWGSLHYIDLFAGSGIERLKDDERILGLDWGSPLIAAQLPKKFDGLHLAELDPKRFSALSGRLEKFRQTLTLQLLCDDGNAAVDRIVSSLPHGSLSVAFLDPYGLDLHFKTLKKLSSKPIDLVIYFPDRVDALRNWDAFEKEPDSKLDRVLGTGDWREKKKSTPPDAWVEMLSKIYLEQIGKLGYTEFEHERIKTSGNQPIYKLIYCSKSKIGSKLWRGVSKRKPSGQDSLDFGG